MERVTDLLVESLPVDATITKKKKTQIKSHRKLRHGKIKFLIVDVENRLLLELIIMSVN